ncbi:MAG: N-acetyltransferase family protein [Rhizobiaceae bacterium]
MQIRPAIEADIADIHGIYEHAVLHGTGTYELEPPTQAEMLKRFRHLTQNNFPWLAAEEGGVVHAYAYASPFRTRPAYRWAIEDSVYVAPEAKGKGVGKMLLQVLLDHCEGRGYHQMIAVIGDGKGNKGSVALHQSLGFKLSGAIEGSGFKFGQWIDTVIMQKALNGGLDHLPDQTRFPASDWQGL